jgi:hypothetical protein
MASLLRQSTVPTWQILTLPHHLQSLTNANPDAAITALRVSYHSDEATALDNPTFYVAYSIASKDIHIDPNYGLSVCLFLPTPPPHHVHPHHASDPAPDFVVAPYREYVPHAASSPPSQASCCRCPHPIPNPLHCRRHNNILLNRGATSELFMLLACHQLFLHEILAIFAPKDQLNGREFYNIILYPLIII